MVHLIQGHLHIFSSTGLRASPMSVIWGTQGAGYADFEVFTAHDMLNFLRLRVFRVWGVQSSLRVCVCVCVLGYKMT